MAEALICYGHVLYPLFKSIVLLVGHGLKPHVFHIVAGHRECQMCKP